MIMVPAESGVEEEGSYSAIVVVITLGSTVALVTTLVICTCFGSLWTKITSFTTKSSSKDKLMKNMQSQYVEPSAIPPGTAKQAIPIQPVVLEKKQAPATITKQVPLAKRKKKTDYLGRVQVHLRYYPSRMILEVTCIQGKYLAGKDVSGFSDPYCIIKLLPATNEKKTTKVIKKTLDPIWNEKVQFVVSKSEVQNQTLCVYVLDQDVLSKDDFIGEARIPLYHFDLHKGQALWKDLSHCYGIAEQQGEILISLCYNPAQEKLIVNVLKARNLPAMDVNHSSDPYVKMWRIHNGEKVDKRRTQVVKKNLNPVFNESFTYNIPFVSIRKSCLLLTVMDHDVLSANDLIGHVLLGSTSSPQGQEHWERMTVNPQVASAQWYSIKKEMPIALATHLRN